jgi:hypothetical protein
VQKLIPSDGQPYDYFGFSVAVAADTAMVGSIVHDSAKLNAGAVYVFTPTPSYWMETQKLTAGDAAPSAGFGGSLALEGDLAIIGAHLDDDAGLGTGAAYAIRRTGSGWVQIGKLLANDGAKNDLF